jgi:hypothetical protein
VEVKITIEAPELVKAMCVLTSALVNSGMHDLADALQGKAGAVEAAVATQPCAEQASAEEPASPKSAEAPAEPEVTLEQVRAKLASLSQKGKQLQVKKLIESFDVKKLTDIPAERYAEVLKMAELI